MGYDEDLTYNVGALEVGKAGLEPALGDEFFRQRDLVVEGGALNGVHDLSSIPT